MYKTAAIGDFEEIGHFVLIGTQPFFPKSKKDAKNILNRLCKEEYAVVFLSEKYADCKIEQKKALPAIMVLWL